MKTLKMTSLFFMAALLTTAINAQASESEYSFKVHNTTRSTIKKLLVSENGKSWSEFDVGRGIGPGQSETMVWDSSTNNEGCKQSVKAVYSDGAESEPAKFDFCEKDLELEF